MYKILPTLHRSRNVMTFVMAIVFTMALTSMAFANSSNGSEFQTLYATVMGWITGIPAIIIALAVAIMGVIRAFTAGSFIWALAGILVAALIFMLPNIISGLGGATI